MIEALKHELKAQGVTYAALARDLGMSEAGVKRMFSRKDFTLKRLDRVLELAGLELAELARFLERRERLVSRLTPEQEKAIIADKKIMLVALRVLNQWPFEKIIRTYTLSEAECVRLFARLDRLGIIRLLPGNRYRLLLSRTFSWLPDGPIQQYFKTQAQNEYFRTPFDGPDELMLFVTGRLSKSSREAMLVRLRRVANEFADSHNDDMRRPFEECTGMNMLLAIRPWELPMFSEMRRKK
ncbi:MAG: helix-turn-helix domain-containing protein [Betaproteobacteria bacterium]|nr:helix-turn-helix domain-containing protein [Betaproteobacteria bacterium]